MVSGDVFVIILPSSLPLPLLSAVIPKPPNWKLENNAPSAVLQLPL